MLFFFNHSGDFLAQRGISYLLITEAIPKPVEMTMLTLGVRRGGGVYRGQVASLSQG